MTWSIKHATLYIQQISITSNLIKNKIRFALLPEKQILIGYVKILLLNEILSLVRIELDFRRLAFVCLIDRKPKSIFPGRDQILIIGYPCG